MSVIVKNLTEAEYLALERAAEFKSEFYNGEMIAMAGASLAHNKINVNLSTEIGGQLKGSPCHTYSSTMRVKIERTGFYTYPDLLIVCGHGEFDAEYGDILFNPQVIIEIVSESTGRNDRGFKFQNYRHLPSLQEYVLVSEEVMWVERFVRLPDELWSMTTFDDPKCEFSLATVPIRVPLADIYRGVEISEEPLP